MHTTATIKSRSTFAGAAALVAIAIAQFAAPAAHAADKGAAPKEELARCYGVNTCKGTSLCATAKNDCKGLNTCKGQGVVVKLPSECKAAGGTLTEPQ
jgi:uncharacterized membrane protein